MGGFKFPFNPGVVEVPKITSAPMFAITTGIAVNNHGGRVGVYGYSVTNCGVYAESAQDIGLYATGATLAAQFDGNVDVMNGDIRLTNADCAEEFDIADAESAEPGTVMVLADGGMLFASSQPYDTRVAGVVAGAGGYKPALVLDKQEARANRRPITLLGKTYCKVDAIYAPINVGDLLTTSATLGHAMKATDSTKALGAIIGKALKPWREGRGLIPLLITPH